MNTITWNDRKNRLSIALRLPDSLAKASMRIASRALEGLPFTPEEENQFSYSREAKFVNRFRCAKVAGWTEYDATILAFVADRIEYINWNKRPLALGVNNYFAQLLNVSGDRNEQQQLQTLRCFIEFLDPVYLRTLCRFDSDSKASPFGRSFWNITNTESFGCWFQTFGEIVHGIDLALKQLRNSPDEIIDPLLSLGGYAGILSKQLHGSEQAIMDRAGVSEDDNTQSKHDSFGNIFRKTNSFLHSIQERITAKLLASPLGLTQLLEEQSWTTPRLKVNDVHLLARMSKIDSLEGNDLLLAVANVTVENYPLADLLRPLMENCCNTMPEDTQIYCWTSLLAANRTRASRYQGSGYYGFEKMRHLVENCICCSAVRKIVLASLSEDLEAAKEHTTIEQIATLVEVMLRNPITEEEDHGHLLGILNDKARSAPNVSCLHTARANLARRQAKRRDVSKIVASLMKYIDSNIDSWHCVAIARILGPLAQPGLSDRFKQAAKNKKYRKQRRLIELMQAAGAEVDRVADLLCSIED